MFRLGLITGILIILFALKEGRFLFFIIGVSMMLSFLLLYGVARIGRVESFLRLYESKRMRRLKREWEKESSRIEAVKDWINRFTGRFRRLVASDLLLTPEGDWLEWKVPAEEEEEKVLDFHLLLEEKGLPISIPLLRLLINQRVLEERWEKIEQIWNRYGAHPPGIGQVLGFAMEERSRTDTREELWTPFTLFYTLSKKFKASQLRRFFPGWKEDPIAAIERKIKEMEELEERKKRAGRLERLLTGKEGGFSLSRFDEEREPSRFAEEVELLLKQLGYRILSQGDAAGFVAERSGVRYYVLPLWRDEGEAVEREGILEAHALYSMAKAHSAMAVTNRRFTPEAAGLATRLGVILVDRERLRDWLYRTEEHLSIIPPV